MHLGKCCNIIIYLSHQMWQFELILKSFVDSVILTLPGWVKVTARHAVVTASEHTVNTLQGSCENVSH